MERTGREGQAEMRGATRVAKGGDSVWMQPPFFFDYGSNIELGERVFFNFNCVVLDVCRIRIGDFTLFGPGAKLLTPVHPFKAALRRKEEYARPIDFGSDVWVGAGALVLPGVRIGSRSVIGAGSVVTETFRKVFSRPVTHAASSRRFLKRNPANIVLYSREVTDVVPRPLLSTKRRCSQTTVRP